MPITVFYSWQTDTPSKANRNFIEEALEKAIKKINANAHVIPAPRDEVQLDKDTAGLPGTPAIVDAILDKIDRCTVFVPDVTFVAQTNEGKLTPNSNVLIEYGWALKSRSRERIVPVMNEVFGAAIEKTPAGEVAKLPFNMRHLTRPIAYNYDGSEPPARTRNQLADRLASAIQSVLDQAPSVAASEQEFKAAASTYEESVFFEPNETVAIRDGNERMEVPGKGAKLFMRLITSGPTEPLLRRQAYDLAIQGGLRPFTLGLFSGGEWHSMNKHGSIVYRDARERYIRHLTQLFLNRELWGLSFELSTDRYRDRMRGFWDEGEEGFNFLPAFFEAAFIRGLEQYARFARECLHLALPLKLKLGITGIEGFKISAPPGMGFDGHAPYGGKAHESDINFETMLLDWEEPAKTILLPFFEIVWDGFGLRRPETTS